MSDIGIISGVTFAMVSSLVLLLYVTLGGRRSRLDTRLDVLADKDGAAEVDQVRQIAMRTLPRMGQALMPKNDEQRTKLQARLVHAGYYGRQAILVFFGVKLVL